MTGPFSSVCIDASRTGPEGADEVEARFRAQAQELERRGAPRCDVDALRQVATAPTGRGGELTRLSVARDGEILLDLVLPGHPPRDESTFGPAPHLLPIARALRFPAPYLVIDVDRAGADIEVVGELGQTCETEQVQGSHELLHKVPSGGWSHRRMQARVQDSWDRNAAEVAAEVDKIVAALRPRLVLVDGDPYAVSALHDALGGAAREKIRHLASGGRAAGIDEEARRQAIDAALAEQASADRHAVFDRFAGARAKQQEAVHGLDAVVQAARRIQVEALLLQDDPTSTATLWSGPEPAQIGMERGDLTAIGVAEPVRMRADAVLVRAILAADADIVLLDADGPAPVEMVDGIGALLRWSDQSTAHDAVPSMPGHGEPPGE